jgi:transcriptional regulator with XRE-family HTH domain
MALYSELPIYRDSYNLLLAIFQATSKFSHEYKYSLGQDMKRDALCLFRNLYRANKAKDKVESLEDFMADFELLKLGNRIRELRKIKGVSQLELAYDMDMSMNTISGIELGKISPKIETLRKIAEKLNVSMSELFEFSKILPQDKITRKKIEEIANKLKPHDKEFLELVDKAIDILLKAAEK